MACAKDCTLDAAGCHKCGAGKMGGPEKCDGYDLGTNTCKSLGFNSGTLSCKADCTLNSSACSMVKPDSSVVDATPSLEQGVTADTGTGKEQGVVGDKGAPDKTEADWGVPDIEPPEQSCNCDAGQAGSTPPLWMLLALAALVLIRRRRDEE